MALALCRLAAAGKWSIGDVVAVKEDGFTGWGTEEYDHVEGKCKENYFLAFVNDATAAEVKSWMEVAFDESDPDPDAWRAKGPRKKGVSWDDLPQPKKNQINRDRFIETSLAELTFWTVDRQY